ncbi:2-hydroxyacid dehydrogenase [Kordiimonas pumila]|uniref:2-hydroxyacid dehydrogenase n=1 Tax=Kordiimonas pumila TaxID=2161677 RepID=A0ABV7D7T9_9PROT|nr:glyoxylate/hydroxypyruvate reductase A [Kordiimonas pumila]
MTRILFYLEHHSHKPWRTAFKEIDPAINFLSYPDWGTPDDGPAYAFVWHPKPGLLKEYTNIKAIFSMGAGIDHILADPDLPNHTPIIRMSDDGLKEGMAEYVTMAVIMHHREIHRFIAGQKSKLWQQALARAAHKTRIGIMGYGALGSVAAKALIPFGYDIAAWSRTKKATEQSITHYHGPSGFKAFLERTDILVNLLPSTSETIGLMNMETMSWLPSGAAIINVGRGSLINLDDLITLLNTDHLSGATLDVFPQEPLSSTHPIWEHDKILVTPHIASITRPDSAAAYVLKSIKILEKGQLPENILDINRGY